MHSLAKETASCRQSVKELQESVAELQESVGAVHRPRAGVSNRLLKLVQDADADDKGIDAVHTLVVDSTQAQ